MDINNMTNEQFYTMRNDLLQIVENIIKETITDEEEKKRAIEKVSELKK